jgi:hypothetical protein
VDAATPYTKFAYASLPDASAGTTGYQLAMLDFVTIEKIAAKAARAQVAESGLERVLVSPAIDSDGKDALRITLVLKPEAVKALSGDAALDLLVDVQRELSNRNEERFPIVEYATEQELLEDKSDKGEMEDEG